MIPRSFSDHGPVWRRVLSLTIVGLTLVLVLSGVISYALDVRDAEDRIRQLRENYTSLLDDAKAAASVAPPAIGPGDLAPASQDLLAPDGAAALSLLQQALQKAVEISAKVEMMHSLDPVEWRGLTVVRAFFRIKDLEPDQLLATIHRLEANKPAIVFDEVRISVHTRPSPMAGSDQPAANSLAELSGVVQLYVKQPSTPSSSGTKAGPP